MAKIKTQPPKSGLLPTPAEGLLQRAQALFSERRRSSTSDIAPADSAASYALVHELQVHQIELEIQNEELRESQLALGKIRENYFDLYDLAPIGYFTISMADIVLKSNLTAASMLCVTRASLVNKSLTRLIHKSDQDIFYLCRKALLESTQLQSCELRMRKPDGSYLWGQLQLALAADAEGSRELRIVVTDITQRKQADEERDHLMSLLKARNLELEVARLAVDQAKLTQSNFFLNVTHELRTPLHAILGFSQLLGEASADLSPAQKNRVDQISKAGWQLLAMVDQIIEKSGGSS